MIVGASCTAELIQDDPGGLAEALGLPIPVIPLELPSYQRKENWGAAETFYQLVRALAGPDATPAPRDGRRPRCNILGPTALGFRHRDDVVEITRLLDDARRRRQRRRAARRHARRPRPPRRGRLQRLLYPEIAEHRRALAGARRFGQPYTRDRADRRRRDARLHRRGRARSPASTPAPLDESRLRLPWWSRSVDSTYLTGKRVFIFGDATHAVAAARIAARRARLRGRRPRLLQPRIRPRRPRRRQGLRRRGADHRRLSRGRGGDRRGCSPSWSSAPRWSATSPSGCGIPCAVISAPVHVQDFPARYSPQMGFEGANVIFDTWVHPLVMGLEEHLLHMFRDDFEFNDAAGASHLGGTAAAGRDRAGAPAATPQRRRRRRSGWPDAEKRTAQDPVLRARQGAAQHRDASPPSRASPRSPSTRSTMRRRIMPAERRPDTASSSSRWTATWRAPPSARAGAAGARLPRPHARRPRRRRMGRATRRRSSARAADIAARRHRHRRRCCSSTSISAPILPDARRRGATRCDAMVGLHVRRARS